MVLMYYKPRAHLTATHGCPGHPTASRAALDSPAHIPHCWRCSLWAAPQTVRICLTSRILDYARWHLSSSQEEQRFSKSTEEQWFIVPKLQQTSAHHIVNECIIRSYAGHIKGIHQASLDSAEGFSSLGLNLQSVIAFQNAIHKRRTEPGELKCLERRKTNKPTNQPNSITFQPLLLLNN